MHRLVHLDSFNKSLEACLGAAANNDNDADTASQKYKRHRSSKKNAAQKVWFRLTHVKLSRPDKISLAAALVFLLLCLGYSYVLDHGSSYAPPRPAGVHPDDAFPMAYSYEAGIKASNAVDDDAVQYRQHFERAYVQNTQQFVQSMADSYRYLWALLDDINTSIVNNVAGGIRWARPDLMPPIATAVGVDYAADRRKHMGMLEVQSLLNRMVYEDGTWFWTLWKKMQPLRRFRWMDEWKDIQERRLVQGPAVDYTDPTKYRYPPKMMTPPAQGGYPKLTPMKEVFEKWPQDEDYHGIIDETLIYFDYSNPVEREASRAFIEKELPFKLYNVPEVQAAGRKWTDDYLSAQFDVDRDPGKLLGIVQESPNNFFCFFNQWDIHTFGLPPVRNNDMTFREFSEHAKYADAVQLSSEMPHFYYQAGDFRHTRFTDENSFIGRDLPSFGSRNETYFVWNVEEQAGIQCRMGERGVIAATHQDPGRNMIAMVSGAKRYILSPPNQCDKLGIFPQPVSPMHRHSIVNYGHMAYLDDPRGDAMSAKERAWLERAATSGVIDTVLKAGEVLYLPSHWFHYFISVQRSTQCNARSGVVKEADNEFGGRQEVITCGQDWGITDPLDFFDHRKQAKMTQSKQ